jgi:hypothetical protein
MEKNSVSRYTYIICGIFTDALIAHNCISSFFIAYWGSWFLLRRHRPFTSGMHYNTESTRGRTDFYKKSVALCNYTVLELSKIRSLQERLSKCKQGWRNKT